MANTFKNFRGALTTSGVTTYTCPAATSAVVLHLQVANVDGKTFFISPSLPHTNHSYSVFLSKATQTLPPIIFALCLIAKI